jgi:valyl-tRNA synthetase
MGHMLNNTIQDVLIRLKGFNALGTWNRPRILQQKLKWWAEINKADLTREEFLKHDWTDKYGGVILEQLKKN